jgi:tetratricopeptide (TPR) repeat protein
MKSLTRAALVLSLLALCPSAHADDIAEAREHFRKGSKAFDLGHYADAIKEYEAAYDIKEDPALLFNIAQAYRLEGDNQNAIRVYKSFLHHLPNARNRPEVERRIEELQKAIDQEGRAKEGPPDGTLPPAAEPQRAVTPPPNAETPAAAPIVAAPAPAEHPGRSKKIAGIFLAAVGVAGIAAGGAFAAMAVKAGDDLTALNQNMGTFDSSKQSAGKTDQIAEGVAFGIGAVALAAGVTLYVLGHRDARRAANAASRATPRLAASGVAVSF